MSSNQFIIDLVPKKSKEAQKKKLDNLTTFLDFWTHWANHQHSGFGHRPEA